MSTIRINAILITQRQMRFEDESFGRCAVSGEPCALYCMKCKQRRQGKRLIAAEAPRKTDTLPFEYLFTICQTCGFKDRQFIDSPAHLALRRRVARERRKAAKCS